MLTAVVAGVGYGIFASASPAAEWVGNLPDGLSTLESHLRALKEPVAQMQKAEETISKLSDIGPRQPQTIVVTHAGLGAVILSERSSLVIGLTATLVLLYFLLSSGDSFLRKLVTVLPRFGDKKQAVEIAQQVQSDVSHYLFTITVINAALGIVVAGVLYALGMPAPPCGERAAHACDRGAPIDPEPGRRVCGAHLLGVALDDPGDAAGGPDAGRLQDFLRPHPTAQADRRVPRPLAPLGQGTRLS